MDPPPWFFVNNSRKMRQIATKSETASLERVALYESKTMIPTFKVSAQPMTSEVRSNPHSGQSDMTSYLRDAIKSTGMGKSVQNYV